MGESKARNTGFSCPNIRSEERQSQAQIQTIINCQVTTKAHRSNQCLNLSVRHKNKYLTPVLGMTKHRTGPNQMLTIWLGLNHLVKV